MLQVHVEYGAMWSGARFRPDDHWRGCLLHIQLCKKPPQKNGQRLRYMWRHVLFSLLNYLTDTKYAPIFFLQNLSGSVYGLRLTLNVEQYEYMKGPNDDAGVKVWCDVIESQIDTTCLRSGNSSWAGERTKLKIILLWMQIMMHEPEEFPLMADNGFAVEPGTHTLITVRNSEVCHRATQI